MPIATFDIAVDLSSNRPVDVSMLHQVTTRLPSGYTPFQPEFRSLAQIADIKLDRQRTYAYRPAGDGLDIAAGFTDARLSVRFVNTASQWRRDGDFMVYLGGTVRITMQIRVYADERTQNGARRRCLPLLYNHELMHVRDEIDIATNWLRSAIENDAFVRGALTVGNRMNASQFDTNVRPGADGAGSYLETRIIQQVYLSESSARSAALHSSRPDDTRQLSACLSG